MENPRAGLCGSYSYIRTNQRKSTTRKFVYQFADALGDELTNANSFYFQVARVDNALAQIQFFDDPYYDHRIPVPNGITLRMKQSNENCPILGNGFVVAWIESYQLMHNGIVVWELSHQKQQSVYLKTRRVFSSSHVAEDSSSEDDAVGNDCDIDQ